MAGPVSVRAGWAIWGKHQGTRDDFSVLAASTEPLSTSEFRRVLAHFAPGNPPAEDGTPASLPWVILSRVRVEDKPYVGMSVQIPAGYVDGTGRPVSRTTYVCVAYDGIKRTPVSYRDLHDAVTLARIPAEDGARVQLRVPPLDPAALARDIREFGEDVVAGTAALLLSGPVTITGPDFPGWEVRLRFLDAVAALLPYGYRAHYTAATWSDTPASAQRFRLVFASRAGSGSFGVPWGTALAPPPGPANPAEEYYASLRRVVKPGADIADLTALIGYLARQTRPCQFGEPGQAVTAIRKFRPASMVAEDIEARIANPGEIREAFGQRMDRQWSADTVRKALAALIEAADPQDAETIRGKFPALGKDDVKELLPLVARACHRLLRSGGDEDAGLVRMYLETLPPFGLGDDLLAQVLTVPDQAPEDDRLNRQAPEDDRLDRAAALVADFAFRDPAAWPRTRDALTRNPAAGTALIAHVCAARSGGAADDAIAWLEPDLAPVLRPFRTLFGQPMFGRLVSNQPVFSQPVSGEPAGDGPAPGTITPEDVRDMSDLGGTAAVRYLLRVASRRHGLGLALPAIACWLCQEKSLGSGEAADGRQWRDMAMALELDSEKEAAWLDLILLATACDPRSLLSEKFAKPRYAAVLADEWQSLAGALNESLRLGQAADDMLTGALIDYLGRAGWQDDRTTKATVERLADLLTAEGQRPLLANAVYDVEATLRQMSPKATPAQIAETCRRAFGRLPADQTAVALARSGAITSGDQAVDMLGHVHWMLARTVPADKQDQASEWEYLLAMAFASGTFGWQIAREFAQAAVQTSMLELRHHLNMIAVPLGNRAPGGTLMLSGEVLRRLKDWHNWLGRLIEAQDGGSRRWHPRMPRMRWDSEDQGGGAR